VTELGGGGIGKDPSQKENVPPALARLIAGTLRIGVGLSAVLALIGVVRLISGSTSTFATAAERGAAFSGSAFLSGLVQGQAIDILFLAFLVLILTPIIRVAISAALFASVQDRQYTALTVTVLLLLGASVLVGALT
jgi:uncharacterized membrane protein